MNDTRPDIGGRAWPCDDLCTCAVRRFRRPAFRRPAFRRSGVPASASMVPWIPVSDVGIDEGIVARPMPVSHIY